MRNPSRIKPFMHKLGHMWQQNLPDCRFGQLMSNFFGFVISETGRDIFFIEDDEMERLMFKYFKGGNKSDECDLEISAE